MVANFKANKTIEEVRGWLREVGERREAWGAEVVVCPSFVALEPLRIEMEKQGWPIRLGAQHVSPYHEGSHTGQVTARMLSGLVDYCLVGHSEAREELGISDENVSQMIANLKEVGIKPILLAEKIEQVEKVLGELTGIEEGNYAVTFEPVEAISEGGEYKPYDAEKAQEVMKKWREEFGLECRLLYGGSVNDKNAKKFIEQADIEGFVVGQASLEAKTFLKILKEVSKDTLDTISNVLR